MSKQSKLAAQFRTTGKSRTELTGVALAACCAALSAGNTTRAAEVARVARLTAPAAATHLGIAQSVAPVAAVAAPAAQQLTA